MDEFEKIYNSIYKQESETADILNSSKEPVNSEITNKDTSTSSEIKDISDEESYFAAYDTHRNYILSDSIYSSESYPEELPLDEPDEEYVEEIQNKNDSESAPKDSKHQDKADFNVDEDDNIDLNDYDEAFSTKSFKDYLTARFAGVILKLRGGIPSEATTATSEDDTENLGKEIPLINASKYYGSYVHSLRLRVRISFFVLLVLAYISIGLPVSGRLNNISIAAVTCIALQFNIILLCLDVFTNGITNAFHGKFGADTLAVLSCFITTIDAILVYTGITDSHMPLCLISSFSLYGVLLSSLLCARGFRKALRVPAIGSTEFTVTGELGITGKQITLLKSRRKIDGFLRRMEEEPVDESIYRRLFPILVLLPVVLTAIIGLITKNIINSVYIFSAIFSISIPFSALLCYTFPFFISSNRLFPYGAAIAGWSGVTDMGHSKNLIITGRDLFPAHTISIEGVRIFADYDSKKVISYACAMIRESKCDLDIAFEKLAQQNAAEDLKVDNFQSLSSGGLKGMIDGKIILCGNSDFMKLMDVKIPSRLIDGTTVLLAIDGVLYGIFDIKYKPDPKVRKALVTLMRSNRHAIFAVRDFNVTPDMLHDCFDIATDGYDFPSYTERFPLSESQPSADSKVAGILCRGGLEPLIQLADTGRSLFVITNTNLIISIASAFLGAIMVSLVLLFGSGITVLGIFLYQLVSTLPIIFLSIMGFISK